MTRSLPRTSRAGRILRLAVVLLVAATAACTSNEPQEPEEVLVQTVRDTLDGAFAYRVVAEADREALDALGDDLASVVARLNLFEASGVVDGEVSSLDVQVFGTAPLLQVSRFSDHEMYLRVGLADGPLASFATPELEGRLLGVAVQSGQPDSIVAAIGHLFDGEWVHLAGRFDSSMLADGSSTEEDLSRRAATPVPELVTEYLTVSDEVEEDGSTTYQVDLQARELVRALARLGGGAEAAGIEPEAFEEGLALLPETVTGDVVVGNGVVQRFVFDVAAAAREDGVDMKGSLQVRLELSDHGRPPLPSVPDAAVTVPSEDLAAGLQLLLTTPLPPARETFDLPSELGTEGP